MKLDKLGFKLLAEKRRFTGETLEIAKRRILDAEPASDLAQEYGVDRKRIYMIENQVNDAWRELHLPPGWSEVTLVAPKALITEFKRRSRLARAELLRKTDRRVAATRRSKPT